MFPASGMDSGSLASSTRFMTVVGCNLEFFFRQFVLSFFFNPIPQLSDSRDHTETCCTHKDNSHKLPILFYIVAELLNGSDLGVQNSHGMSNSCIFLGCHLTEPRSRHGGHFHLVIDVFNHWMQVIFRKRATPVLIQPPRGNYDHGLHEGWLGCGF